MSCPRPPADLPPETVDSIVDLLHNEPEMLKRCCLVSKSWIPRTRKHLFATINFHTPAHLEAWKTTFSDPSNSPAHCARTLSINCHLVDVTTADAAEGGWLPTFSRVVRLEFLTCSDADSGKSLALFHKLSPTLKSLAVSSILLPLSQLSELIQSLPHLEDLTLIGRDPSNEQHTTVVSSPTSPPLTGTLELVLFGGMAKTVRQLLDVPSGIYFRTLRWCWCREEDVRHMMKLVVACSNTLESLDVLYHLKGEVYPVSLQNSGLLELRSADESKPWVIDLSKATKLKYPVFQCESLDSGWITRSLKTITPEHRDLQKISITIPSFLGHVTAEDCEGVERRIEEADPGTRWSDLEHLLVTLWESHSVRVKVVYPQTQTRTKDWAVYLFPELTKRGIIEVVEEAL
jgi:hypothetical protein